MRLRPCMLLPVLVWLSGSTGIAGCAAGSDAPAPGPVAGGESRPADEHAAWTQLRHLAESHAVFERERDRVADQPELLGRTLAEADKQLRGFAERHAGTAPGDCATLLRVQLATSGDARMQRQARWLLQPFLRHDDWRHELAWLAQASLAYSNPDASFERQLSDMRTIAADRANQPDRQIDLTAEPVTLFAATYGHVLDSSSVLNALLIQANCDWNLALENHPEQADVARVHREQAKNTYARIVKEYPRSLSAELAAQTLRSIDVATDGW